MGGFCQAGRNKNHESKRNHPSVGKGVEEPGKPVGQLTTGNWQ
jgi:hypothetical protein